MAARALRYERLAALFDYPGPGYLEHLDLVIRLMEDGEPARGLLTTFRRRLEGMTVEEIQELFTRTFDINPACTLEIGWHIHGEDYARGEFLVQMRRLLRENNLPESRELPDHLVHVLALLGRLDAEDGDHLAASYLLPALDRMLSGLTPGEHPHLWLMKAARAVVCRDHDVEPVPPRAARGDPPGWTHRLPVHPVQRRR